MKNEKLITAQALLREHGFPNIPDATILAVIDAIKRKSETVYDPGDFVAFYEGMGEMGFGEVITKNLGNYSVQVWTPDPVKYPSFPTIVGGGDMRGISSVEQAQEYFNVRSSKE